MHLLELLFIETFLVFFLHMLYSGPAQSAPPGFTETLLKIATFPEATA